MKKQPLLRLLMGVVSIAVCASAFAQKTIIQKPIRQKMPRQLLSSPAPLPLVRMIRAEHQYPYIAREVVQDKKGTRERLVKHHPTRGTRRESVQESGGITGGETLLDNYQNTYVISPRGTVNLQETSTYANLLKQQENFLQKLQKGHFTLEKQGNDTVAGRSVEVIRIGPKLGKKGPTWRLWLDKETGLRLRLEQQDPEGRIILSAYYVSLDLAPVFTPQDFTVPTGVAAGLAERLRPTRFSSLEAATKAGYTLVIPSDLREGYRLKEVLVAPNKERLTSIWTTGMMTLSLVQIRYEQMPPALARQISERPGFIAEKAGRRRAYGWRKGDLAFLLLGDLPEENLRHIADSMR